MILRTGKSVLRTWTGLCLTYLERKKEGEKTGPDKKEKEKRKLKLLKQSLPLAFSQRLQSAVSDVKYLWSESRLDQDI